MRVFDPLGCIWAEGFDVEDIVAKSYNGLNYLKSITREHTTKAELLWRL